MIFFHLLCIVFIIVIFEGEEFEVGFYFLSQASLIL